MFVYDIARGRVYLILVKPINLTQNPPLPKLVKKIVGAGLAKSLVVDHFN